MFFLDRVATGARNYLGQLRRFNRNVRLLLLASMLSYLASGIFSVDFNLYILSIGIKPDGLGKILSAAPLAHMLAAIPIGFFAERLGFRKAFMVIYSLTGLALLSQVATSSVLVITAGAFLGGLAISGDFVVRLPFLSANIQDTERTYVFSMDAFLSGITYAVGALLAGFLPNLFRSLGLDLTVSYRLTLYASGAMMILAVIPVLLIKDHTHLEKRKISLSPYLWGMDRFTLKAAVVEFFIGLTFGMIIPFMNIIFIYHLNTTREFYSAVEALAFIPTITAALLGPILVQRLGNVRGITLGRAVIPICLLVLGLAIQPLVGAGAYWGYKAIFSMTQSVWFAFAMATATRKAKGALSAWLEITFQAGIVIAEPVSGILLNNSNYTTPFLVSTAAAIATCALTWIFMRPYEARVVPEPAGEPTASV